MDRSQHQQFLVEVGKVLFRTPSDAELWGHLLPLVNGFFQGWSAHSPCKGGSEVPSLFADASGVRELSDSESSHLFGAMAVSGQRSPWVVTDWRSLEMNPRATTNGLLVLPLSFQDQALGTLAIGATPKAFDDADLFTARALSESISFVLHHRQLNRRLMDVQKSKETLFSMIAHEIRVPLTSLRLLMEFLSQSLKSPQQGAVSPDRIFEIIRNAQIQVDQSTALLDEMVAFSRIESDNFRVRFDPINLAVIVSEAMSILQPELDRAGILLETLCPPAALIRGEAVRIRQVLLNLVNNAMKYSCQNQIRIEVEQAAHFFRVRVIDYGKGIPPKLHQQVFDCFDRGSEPCDGRGLGLGLYISRKIIKAHGGRIWIENLEPVGCAFVFDLPIG
ncbi:MAG: HAMP domain-containing histidine kinase [Bdellovibrionales bacterium]|nr:HAMP domain-containing histidine kinase [Bdellovibrionales bacterium]